MKYTSQLAQRSVYLLALLILLMNSGAAHASLTTAAPRLAEQQQTFLPLLLGGAANSTPRVHVTLDPSRATHAAIGAEGGTLSAEAANGARFDLAIPPGALDYTETITMTPASAVDNLPLSGGLSGAVSIEPAGLLLYESAILKITPAAPPSGPLTLGFGYDGDGAQFHLRPAPEAANIVIAQAGEIRITMEIRWIRGYGVGSGTRDDVAQQQAQPGPSDPMDAMAEDLVIIPFGSEQHYSRTAAVFEQDVYPLLEAAETNAALADRAIQRYELWLDYINGYLQAPPNRFADQIARAKARMLGILEHAADVSAERCFSQKRPEEGFALLRWIRYAKKHVPGAPLIAASESKLAKCLTFRVIFHSHMTEIESALWGWQYDLHADFMLHAGVGGRATGSGPLAYDGVTWLGDIFGCSLSGNGTGSTFDASSGLRLTPVSRSSAAVKLAFSYDPGTPGELKRIVCPISGIDGGGTTTDWRTYYAQLHDYEQSASGFTAETTITGVGSFEGWVYHHTGAGSQGALTEDTQIEIKHMPER